MANREQTLRSYLLGDMKGAEREALEREYFADPRLFERLVQAENELVDAYARGLLPPETRARFERYYMTHPARRERAEFARALAATLERPEAQPQAAPAEAVPLWRRLLAAFGGPRLAWALSASLLLMGAAAAWLYIESGRQQRELAGAGGERSTPERGGAESRQQVADDVQGVVAPTPEPTPEPDATPAEQKTVRPSPTPAAKTAPVVATLVLTVGGTRGAVDGAPATLLLTGRTEQVSLRLNLSEADYRSYSGVLRRAGGGEVFSWRRVITRAATSGKTVSLLMPARGLTEGDYVLTLKGTRDTGEAEDVSVSLFSVERR
ncbi:MAG TPA: hypothetical protein VF621_18830 [Pyrinomonadaceae bacterium]|jgi:AcrR family transcriptional regulator